MPGKGKADKRKEQYESSDLQAANMIANEIEALKESKAVLNLEKTNSLIKLYEDMGKEMQTEYKAIQNDPEKTRMYETLSKRFSKDYLALLRYKKRIENAPEPKPKEKKKSGGKKKKDEKPNPTDHLFMDIESFYESTRTRTITVPEEEFAVLDTTGSVSNTRYKVPFIVENEPVQGKKKGDSCVGFFTMSESYNSDDRDTVMEEKAKAMRTKLAEKYPEAADFLKTIDYKTFVRIRSNEEDNAFDNLENKPYEFGINRNRKQSKEYITEWIDKADASDEEKERCKEDLKNIDSNQKFLAYVEYMSSMLKADAALKVREGCGIKLGADTSQRNALTSVFAEVLGCSQYVAFSEKVKIKTRKNGKDVVLKGVLMMPAKGKDMSTEGIGSQFEKIDGMSFEDSPGLVKNIAAIQFLDFIIRNPDRHGHNLLYSLNKKDKVAETEAIDNDTAFIFGDNKELRQYRDLGIIPKSMADIVKNTDTKMFEILMQGYGLEQNEIDKVVDEINNLKDELADSEDYYKDKIPLYINPFKPRIVPDQELDQYSINGQLAIPGTLFTKILGEAQRDDMMDEMFTNDVAKVGELSKEVLETFTSASKPAAVTIVENKDSVDFGDKGLGDISFKFDEMRTECWRLDNLDKVSELRFIKPDIKNNNFIYDFDDEYEHLKNVVNSALTKTEDFLNAVRNDAFENGGKYEEYQTLKAERDFYTKEYSKDGDISDINRKKLDDLDDEIKTLEETPEVKVVLAAIKNRDALQKMADNLNTIEPIIKKLPNASKKLDEFQDKCSDDPKLKNSYEGTKKQRDAEKLRVKFNDSKNIILKPEKKTVK